ncbi:MAG: hypothetical protein AB1742_11650, partial [bacterium]
MKKTALITAAFAAFALTPLTLFSAPTATNWSVTLTFSTANTADLLPVTIGESSAAQEMLKPPPLPGMADTSNPEDAVVNAYVRSADRSAATSILVGAESETAKMWEIKVDAEEASADVSVTADVSSLYEGYKLFVIDGDTGAKTELTSSSPTATVFNTGASPATKALYAMVGTTQTFVIGKSTGSLLGSVTVGGRTDHSGVNVYLDGSNTPAATTDASGGFTVAGISAGTHQVKIDGDYVLASKGSIDVPASGSAA